MFSKALLVAHSTNMLKLAIVSPSGPCLYVKAGIVTPGVVTAARSRRGEAGGGGGGGDGGHRPAARYGDCHYDNSEFYTSNAIYDCVNTKDTDLEPGTVIVAILIRTGRGLDPGTGLGVRDLCWEQHSNNSEMVGI